MKRIIARLGPKAKIGEFDKSSLSLLLKVNQYSNEEIKDSFNQLKMDSLPQNAKLEETVNKSLSIEDFKKIIISRNITSSPTNSPNLDPEFDKKLENMIKEVGSKSNEISSDSSIGSSGGGVVVGTVEYGNYEKYIKSIGEKLDPRVWPITLSFGMTGTSVGVILPCMPLLIQSLSITHQQYGFVIASFGVSKLLGNIPVGYLVDRLGRKSAIILGLGLCSVGLGGISAAMLPGFGVPWLMFCRFLSGLGVSSFVGGATTYITDISNSVNRTRSMAPLMASFQAGTAFGPALGGALMGIMGIAPTFASVGMMFASLGYFNHKYLDETKKQDPSLYANQTAMQGVKSSIDSAFTAWKLLIKEKEIISSTSLQFIYNVAISGSQMTLLPLLMVEAPLSLSAIDIGYAFAGMSAVSVLTAQPTAKIADKFGKIPVILGSCCLVSVSMMNIPLATSLSTLLAALIPLSVGSTTISSVTQAQMSDLVSPPMRPQALSLLRTAGDCGLITGALASIVLADAFSVGSAIAANGMILLGGVTLFGYRTWNNWRIFKSKT